MTAEEKGKCSTVFRGGDTKASLYSWEWEQEVCHLILNTSLILACKHPFITHECDGETWDSVSVEESSASRADWSDWSDGRVTACSGLCAEKLFVCWHTLNYFIVAHFHSISIVEWFHFDHENSVFCLIHKEKNKKKKTTAAVFNTAVPRECAEPLQLFVIQRILVQYDFHRPLMLLFHTLTAELSRSSVNIYSHKITLNQP